MPAGCAGSVMEHARMSTFDNPFDPQRRLSSWGCSCGRHRSQAEHDSDACFLQHVSSLDGVA